MRYVVTVRGKLKGTTEQAHKVHDQIVSQSSSVSRSMGNTSHRVQLNIQNNNEFLAIDVWDNLENLQKRYSDPNLGAAFGQLFDGPPDITIWAEAGWLEY